MNKLTLICQEAEQAFKEFYPDLKHGKLEEVAKEWINGNERIQIVGYTIKPGDKVIIAVKNEPILNKPKFDRYYILRFFPGGKGWHISQDLASADHDNFVQFLLSKMK